MRPRAVDWSLLLLVTLETLSGFSSFLVGRPEGSWVFVVHGVIGLAICLLLAWKLHRVWRRLVQPARWEGATVISVLALIAVLLVLLTGLIWTTWQWPAGFPNGLYLHVSGGLALLVLMLAHMALRFKPLRLPDLQGRRTALRFLTVLASGGALWLGNQGANLAGDTPGNRRRFTGSRDAGAAFPVTMWMLDNPPPVDRVRWRLRVSGNTTQEIVFTDPEIVALATEQIEATLDCTSGWYSTQRWQGVSVARLLDQVELAPDAIAVSFKSVTGYRWSLPLPEAKAALLATHVGDEPLAHGHGAPLRLVAPGRRGFQWVKWVTEVEVLTVADYGQWVTIFSSGL
jgi:DMSO/TMAO reductase YedYZ molybdopterin-dependent catalytic subunit